MDNVWRESTGSRFHFMNTPEIALKKLREIIHKWEHMDSQHINGAYAAAKAIVLDLSQQDGEEPLDGEIVDKLNTLNWHINAAFGADDDNGHPRDQHLLWALDAIDTLSHMFRHRH